MVTFNSKCAIKIGDDTVRIETLFLVQRLIIIGTQTNDLDNTLRGHPFITYARRGWGWRFNV